MPAIHLNNFAGARPRVGPRLLGPNEARIAENCRLWSGEIGAWRRPSNVFPVGQNYLVWSNQFQQSGSWTQLALNGVTANASIAPDGSTTADKLLESTGNSSHRVRQAIVKSAVSEFWCGACSGKASERNFMWVRVDDGTDAEYAQAIINLTTGAITLQQVTSTFTNLSVTVEAEANAFYRLHIVSKTNTTTALRLSTGMSTDGTTISYAGTSNSGIFVDGASLRKSDKPGPYRETLATSLPADPTTIYGFRDTWFVFNEIAHLAAAPLAGDTIDTTYFTRASGEPRVTYSPIAEDTTGSGDRPRASFSMGLPVPANPVTVVPVAATGTITAALSLIQSAGSFATQNYSLPSATVDGTPVKGKLHFKVTVSTAVAQRATVRFFATRNTIAGEIASVEMVGDFNPVPGATDIQVFEYTLEFDDAPPSGNHTYTANTTVTFAAGGAFTPTYAHLGGSVRYAQTRITSAAHVRVVGDQLMIQNVLGMEAINTASVAVTRIVDANNFYVDIDSDGQTYTSGGTWTQVYDDEDLSDTAYVFTWLSTIGTKVLEGPPSAPSNIVARGDGQLIQVSSIDTIAPSDGGSYNFSGKRIYRTNVRSDLGANYQFVAQIAVGTTSYNDTIRDIALGEVLPSADWLKPPTDMKGLIELTNGVLAGYSGKDVCFCEPYQPHAWPVKYRLRCFNDIVGLVGTGASTVVLTEGKPHFIHGTTPGEMDMVKVEAAQPCVSARGIVDAGYVALYPGDDGYVSLSPGGTALVTQDVFTKEEWQALNPTTIIASEHDDRIVAFFTRTDGTQGGFVLDPKEQDAKYTELDFGASAVWTNPATGDLYALIDEYIAKWDAASDFYDFRWRSKTFRTPPVNMSWLKVDSTEYPITVDIYANRNPDSPEALDLIYSGDVSSSRAMRLPGDYIATLYEIELRGNGEGRVMGLHMATSIEDLVGG